MTAARHPLFARLYSRVTVPFMSKRGADLLRTRMLDGLSGTVVEVGAGDGANFGFYPQQVSRVVAVEPEPYLRRRAIARAGADSRFEVVDGAAESLPMADGSADAVVCSLVLCSVDSEAAALAEARRVLATGGQLRILEHVLDHEPGRMRSLQKMLDAWIYPRIGGGCHCARDTVAEVEQAGFTFVDLDRFRFPDGSRGPESSMVLGTAR